MPDERRVRTALRDALNGDADTIDPAVRRGLTVLAVATDDIEERFERLEASFDRIERKITSATTSIIVAVLSAAGGIIWALVS